MGMFRAKGIAETNVTGDSSWHLIKFQLLQSDPDWSIINQDRIRCNRAGLYMVSAGFYYTGGAATNEGARLAIDLIRPPAGNNRIFTCYNYNKDYYTPFAQASCCYDNIVDDDWLFYFNAGGSPKGHDGPQTDARYNFLRIVRVGE